MSGSDAVLVPVRTAFHRFDSEDPAYRWSRPDVYVALALAYDCLAAPRLVAGADGVYDADWTQMRPRLAQSWFEHANGDWTVTLRPDSRSHQGNELTAEDIVWSFAKAYHYDTLARWRRRDVMGIQQVTAESRYEVRFHLQAPYPTFPNWLLSTTPNVVDATAIQAHCTPEDPWGVEWLATNVAGFGAYAIDAMDATSVRFVPRAGSWRPAADPAPIDVQTWPGDRESALALLDEPRPVMVVGTDCAEDTRLLRRDDLQIKRAWAGHLSVDIDWTAGPWKDKRVRHALAYATPYDRVIAEGMLGLGRRWQSPVKHASQWYSPAGNDFRFDLAKAREMLAAAGYGGGIQAPLYLPMRPDAVRIAEILAATWRQAGIEVDARFIEELPDGEFPELFLHLECAHNLTEPIYDIAHDYFCFSPIYPAPGGPIGSAAGWVFWARKNDTATEQFGELLLEQDRDSKRRLFDDMQRYLIDFSSSIFIAEHQQTVAGNARVPAGLMDQDERLVTTLLLQNAITGYLPAWPRPDLAGVGA